MAEYRRLLPNYVVVLVKKVLDSADAESTDLASRFYPVTTYCQIKYH